MGDEECQGQAGATISPRCPQCGAEVPVEAVDIAHAAIFCRTCDRSSHIPVCASCFGDERDVPFSPDAPPRPAPPNHWARVKQGDHELSVCRRFGAAWVVVLMFPGVIAWVFAAVMVVSETLRQPTTRGVLLSAGLVLGLLFLCLLVGYLFFGYESLHFGRDRLHYEGRGLLGRRRVVDLPLSELLCLRYHQSGHAERAQSFWLSLETSAGPVSFARASNDTEILWLGDLIQRHLWAHAPSVQFNRDRSETILLQSLPCPLSVQDPPVMRPRRTNIRLRRDGHRTAVWTQMSLGDFVSVVVINAIYNGLLWWGVWTLLSTHWGGWLVLPFILPFIAIGMLLLLFLLAVIVTLVSRKECVFEPGQVTQRTSILGFGRVSRMPFRTLRRVELRRSTEKRMGKVSRYGMPRKREVFAVGLVQEDGRDLVELGPFRLDEARWVADELLHDFRDWMVKVG